MIVDCSVEIFFGVVNCFMFGCVICLFVLLCLVFCFLLGVSFNG